MNLCVLLPLVFCHSSCSDTLVVRLERYSGSKGKALSCWPRSLWGLLCPSHPPCLASSDSFLPLPGGRCPLRLILGKRLSCLFASCVAKSGPCVPRTVLGKWLGHVSSPGTSQRCQTRPPSRQPFLPPMGATAGKPSIPQSWQETQTSAHHASYTLVGTQTPKDAPEYVRHHRLWSVLEGQGRTVRGTRKVSCRRGGYHDDLSEEGTLIFTALSEDGWFAVSC